MKTSIRTPDILKMVCPFCVALGYKHSKMECTNLFAEPDRPRKAVCFTDAEGKYHDHTPSRFPAPEMECSMGHTVVIKDGCWCGFPWVR